MLPRPSDPLSPSRSRTGASSRSEMDGGGAALKLPEPGLLKIPPREPWGHAHADEIEQMEDTGMPQAGAHTQRGREQGRGLNLPTSGCRWHRLAARLPLSRGLLTIVDAASAAHLVCSFAHCTRLRARALDLTTGLLLRVLAVLAVHLWHWRGRMRQRR